MEIEQHLKNSLDIWEVATELLGGDVNGKLYIFSYNLLLL